MGLLKKAAFIFFFFLTFFGTAQEQIDSLFPGVDSLYREDQIYVGFSYNILVNPPEGISQSGFSGGFHAGFIRDFPVNQRRNIAIGLGLGWSINTYGQNLLIGEEEVGENTIFRVLEDDGPRYDSNRFSIQAIDVPIQFRWRSSDFDSNKFWRVYTGIRLGYVYHFKSTFVESGNPYRQTDVPEFNPFQAGATFTFGYNTFNFSFYYSLTPFFNEDAMLKGEPIDLTTFHVGLMFYIL